ncbi:hypothetical protein J7E88_17825 [Streptomyces sp. ISL-10]|uniref:hypothetical protein n=1 Tax=Streptomyces sp. ISL-10 TaxID=2819172 RepID=UPI001BE786AB|nr:hypothetical protein [Streptomyces sp. ISL-10]MBT2367115.1 hypothetical protein [Streptomyces sp. ISL-10]
MTNTTNSSPDSSTGSAERAERSAGVDTGGGTGGGTGNSVLELIALLCLITLATVVYAAAGPEAFAAVTGVGGGLFTTWRGRPRR